MRYTEQDGRQWDLAKLGPQERALVTDLQDRVRNHPDWNDFDNYWLPRVTSIYEAEGLTRSEISRKAAFCIALDLSGRLAIAQGLARPSDYRDDLTQIIHTHFKSRRAFCAATGLTEDMLSHVLARRKHLAIGTLEKALGKIGYRIRLTPEGPPAARKPRSRKTQAG